MSDPRNPPAWGHALSEDDYIRLGESWITRELADEAMLRRVNSVEGREVVGQKGNRDYAGILIPYYWPGDPTLFNYRLRRDNPEWEEGKDGKLKPKRKYLGPPRGANRLYIPPGITLEQLRDTRLPIVIMEGEKKALALWRLANYNVETPQYIPIAIAGVWNWRGKVGRAGGPRGEWIDLHGPIPDLSRIEWTRRTALIVFDADVHTNDGVRAARKWFARELAGRGAKVRLINLPQDSCANGVDELLVAWGPDRVLKLFDQPDEEPPTEHELGQSQLLIALADDATLFHTPEGEAYAQVLVDDHRETWTLRSKSFRRWIVRKFYERSGKPPGSQPLQDAVGLLEAKAQFDGPEAPLFVRLAGHDGRIFVDLCDAKWRVIEIGPDGWRFVSDAPVHFRRARGMQALPEPTSGGSMLLLQGLINIGDESNWILCVSWLVAACRPSGPFPILILQGEQGSAKSTMVKLLRKIIDPSSSLVRTPPRDARDLVIAARNSWIIAYDNLSCIAPWLSDSFCRLATGGGFSTRQLYTDDDEVLIDATRPVVLNGIDHLADRADLADRAVILNLPPIPNENRRDEAQLYGDFDRHLPQILGALFTAVSVALGRLAQTTLDSKPRMADFALWATAAEPAFGFPPGAFMRTYSGNRAEAVQETLESDPVGVAILGLVDRYEDSWEGTCKQLLHELEQHVEEPIRKSREWPKSPRGLSGRLRRLVTFLRELQILIEFHPRGTNGQRNLTITRRQANSTAPTATTVTRNPDDSPDQSVTPEGAGDGPHSEMADVAAVADQPPLRQSETNSSEQIEYELEVAVMAGMPVVREAATPQGSAATSPPEYANFLVGNQNPGAPPQVARVAMISTTSLPDEQTASCPRCGPVHWQRLGSVLVCSNCGQEAPGANCDLSASAART